MPLLLIAGLGALAGFIVAPSANNNLSALEGALAGVVVGVGVAAVFFAIKKI